MAPFPETEIMTIKRLEVALRKMDFKLLKDGAYKLHEKYHSGHQFEYLDLLKELFVDVSNNSSIPEDIKDILIPTIEDILSKQGIKADASTSPYGANGTNENREHVSSLTSLSYSANAQNAHQESHQEEQKINAFDAFSSKQNHAPIHQNYQNNQPQQHQPAQPMSYSQSPFSAQPFKEFSMPENNESAPQPEQVQEPQPQEQPQEQVQAQTETKAKTIGIFFGKDNTTEKAKNIIKYQELISKMEDNHSSITEILNLISEINTQSNVNVSEIKTIFDQLKNTENKVKLVTNSSSAQFISLFEENEYSYTLFNDDETKKTSLLPLFGLSNLFVCENCGQEFLDKETNITPLVLQCPKCKSPMFPNFYASNGKRAHLNIDFYNEALVSLAKSDVWFIIHPVLEEKTTVNLLANALKLNKNIEKIYILDKDINVRENCKNIFRSINENIEINTQVNALEDFLNLIK